MNTSCHGYSQLVWFRLSLLFFLFFFLLSALAEPAMVLDLIEEWKTFFDSLPEDLRPASILTALSPVMSAAPAPVVLAIDGLAALAAGAGLAALTAPSPAGDVPDSAPSPLAVGSDLVSLVEVHCVNEFA